MQFSGLSTWLITGYETTCFGNGMFFNSENLNLLRSFCFVLAIMSVTMYQTWSKYVFEVCNNFQNHCFSVHGTKTVNEKSAEIHNLC